MSVKLSAAALARLPAGVAAPKYRRSDLSAGIVHIGVGNFHRAHQAVYLDDLFNADRDHDWAIIGAGVRDPDVTVREKLRNRTGSRQSSSKRRRPPMSASPVR
jgi:mannitol 2-dehydrogenase